MKTWQQPWGGDFWTTHARTQRVTSEETASGVAYDTAGIATAVSRSYRESVVEHTYISEGLVQTESILQTDSLLSTYNSAGAVTSSASGVDYRSELSRSTSSDTYTNSNEVTGRTTSSRAASLATRSYSQSTTTATTAASSHRSTTSTATSTRVGTTSNSTLTPTTTEETFTDTFTVRGGTVSTTASTTSAVSSTADVTNTAVSRYAPEDHEIAWIFTATGGVGSPTQIGSSFTLEVGAPPFPYTSGHTASLCASVTQTYTATRFTSATENVTISTTVPATLTQFSFEGFLPMTKTVSRAVELVSTTATTATNSVTTTGTVSGIGTSSSVSVGARIWSFATAPITVQADVSSSFTTTFQIRYQTSSSVAGLYFPVVALSRTSSATSDPVTISTYAGNTVTNTVTSSTYAFATVTVTEWTPPALSAFSFFVEACFVTPGVATASFSYVDGVSQVSQYSTTTHNAPADHSVSYETWTQSSYTTTQNQITASGTFTATNTSFSTTASAPTATFLRSYGYTTQQTITLAAPLALPFETPAAENQGSGDSAMPSWPNVTAHLRPVMPGIHAPTAVGIADSLFANLSASPSIYYPFAFTGRRYTRTVIDTSAESFTSVSTFEHVSPALFTDDTTYSTGSTSYTARFDTSDSLLHFTGRSANTAGSVTSTSTTNVSVAGSATFSFTEVFPVEWSLSRYTAVANPGATNESTHTTADYVPWASLYPGFSRPNPGAHRVSYNGRAFSAAGGASPMTAADLNPAFYFAPGVFHLTSADSSTSSSFATTFTAPTWSTSANALGIAIPEYQPSVYSAFRSHGTYFCYNSGLPGDEVFLGRTDSAGRTDAPLARATFTLSRNPIYETS